MFIKPNTAYSESCMVDIIHCTGGLLLPAEIVLAVLLDKLPQRQQPSLTKLLLFAANVQFFDVSVSE